MIHRAAMALAVFSITASAQIVEYEVAASGNWSYGVHGRFKVLGDVNVDGVADFVGLAPQGLDAFSGADGAPLWSLAGTGLNWVVPFAVVGDLNADGVDDLLVSTNSSETRVLSGTDGATLRTIALSGSVGRAGFVDSDAVEDYTIDDRVYSGADDSLIQDLQFVGGSFDIDLALPLGDLTGDGHDETLFVWDTTGFGSSVLRIYSGVDGVLVRNTGLGEVHSLTVLGDLNGDGFSDYATSTLFSARIYSGLTGDELSFIDDNMGFFDQLGGTGDVNGDGVGDFAHNLFLANFGAPTTPMVEVRSGLDGESLFRLVPPALGPVAGFLPLEDSNASQMGGFAVVWDTNPALITVVRSLCSDCSAPEIICEAKLNSLGCTPEINWSGLAQGEGSAPFVVSADNVLSNRNGLLFYGYAPGRFPFLGGTLCVQPPLRRTAPQNSGGNGVSDCSGVYSFDFGSLIAAGSDALLAEGQSVTAQFWSRDPQASAGAGLTDAVEFVINP